MTITINGTTGITNDGGYTGDGVVFADTTPANTLVTDTSGNVGMGTNAPGYRLDVAATDTTAGFGYGFRIRANSTAGAGSIQFTDNPVSTQYGVITGSTTEFKLLADGRPMTFFTGGLERARIDSSGNLLVGRTSAYADGSMGTPVIQAGGVNGVRAGAALIQNSTASTGAIGFANPNGYCGGISTSGTSTTYATSSDYRLKENIAPMTGALAKVAALKPVTYTWKATGEVDEGFIAHELQEVCSSAVTGEKDAVDIEGNPRYQGIDTSFLVATLTAAIQEQQQLITALTARVAALDARLTSLEGTQP